MGVPTHHDNVYLRSGNTRKRVVKERRRRKKSKPVPNDNIVIFSGRR